MFLRDRDVFKRLGKGLCGVTAVWVCGMVTIMVCTAVGDLIGEGALLDVPKERSITAVSAAVPQKPRGTDVVPPGGRRRSDFDMRVRAESIAAEWLHRRYSLGTVVVLVLLLCWAWNTKRVAVLFR